MFITGVNNTGDELFTGEQLAPGSLVTVCEVSMDAPFHVSSNDTLGRIYRRFGGLRGL
jgi:hypothetical protein